MLSEKVSELLQTVISSGKASVSVILVLLYGFLLRKYSWITKEGESNISKIGTTFLLPALLFSEIGPVATFKNLASYWPIIVLNLFFQLISLLVGQGSHYFGVPQQFVPLFIFSNVTSLPLLLFQSLGQTGSLKGLVGSGETMDEVLQRGRVYILINALVGNMTRFALGPYLMKTHRDSFFLQPHSDDPNAEDSKDGQIKLNDDVEDDESVHSLLGEGVRDSNLPKSIRAKRLSLHLIDYLKGFFNPPVIGGICAIFFGLIPFFHQQLFKDSGFLSPLADSIKNVGGLYTALQMFILGAHLCSKSGKKGTNLWILVWLFGYRFFLAPAISIATVYLIRHKLPNLMLNDPVLDFVLSISNTGPPAITLSAIAEMADLPDDIEGMIAWTLTLSYAVTPIIALPVTAALNLSARK